MRFRYGSLGKRCVTIDGVPYLAAIDAAALSALGRDIAIAVATTGAGVSSWVAVLQRAALCHRYRSGGADDEAARFTPLMAAVAAEQKDVVDALLAAGVSADAGGSATTPLMVALRWVLKTRDLMWFVFRS